MAMSKSLEVITPQSSQLISIDQQPQMAFGVQSIDRQTLKNNVVALAKAAQVFKMPTTITTVETEGFSGNTYPEPLAVRTCVNSWDDQNVRAALANPRKSSSRDCGPRSATPHLPSAP
jgi:nicotinamidase-related amidase